MSSLRIVPLLLVMLLLSCGYSRAAAPRVWFDEGHGQAFKVGGEGDLQLSGLGEIFRAAGWEVAAGSQRLTPKLLASARALVISGPFAPLAPDEVAAVLEFLRNGGRLAVLLHIGPPVAGLLRPLGVYHSNGVIHDEQHRLDAEGISFRVRFVGRHPLARNLEGFALYGSWALLAEGADTEVLARSSAQSWVDLNGNGRRDAGDAQQAFAVLVHGRFGRGEYLVFGDDAVFQNRFLQGDNRTLARNLAAWLQQGPAAGELALLDVGSRSR